MQTIRLALFKPAEKCYHCLFCSDRKYSTGHKMERNDLIGKYNTKNEQGTGKE